MISRHALHLGDDHEIRVWLGWTSWLLGVDVDSHPRERTLMLRLGPIGLSWWWRR